MLKQEALIERVRSLCWNDGRLVVALMYCSWLLGEFDDLIRGEFHFDKASHIARIDTTWHETASFPSADAAIVHDRTGELTRRVEAIAGAPLDRASPERVGFLCRAFVNWVLFGSTVRARGERAQALDMVGQVQCYLLWLVRLQEDAPRHWPTPSRALERDFSECTYACFAGCMAPLDGQALEDAHAAAWGWDKEPMVTLGAGDAIVPAGLIDKMDGQLERDEGGRFGR